MPVFAPEQSHVWWWCYRLLLLLLLLLRRAACWLSRLLLVLVSMQQMARKWTDIRFAENLVQTVHLHSELASTTQEQVACLQSFIDRPESSGTKQIREALKHILPWL